ncbi:MAG: hypothetical protein RQ741_08840 [Wenzhouxiangellaceae bacterium]|nr:hypothetical protein [Wenzhouxiangellaceae bacterium]
MNMGSSLNCKLVNAVAATCEAAGLNHSSKKPIAASSSAKMVMAAGVRMPVSPNTSNIEGTGFKAPSTSQAKKSPATVAPSHPIDRWMRFLNDGWRRVAGKMMAADVYDPARLRMFSDCSMKPFKHFGGSRTPCSRGDPCTAWSEISRSTWISRWSWPTDAASPKSAAMRWFAKLLAKARPACPVCLQASVQLPKPAAKRR